MIREDNDSIAGAAGAIAGLAVRVILLALMILALFVGIRKCYSFGYAVFYQEAAEEAPGQDVKFEISKGETLEDVAEKLVSLGLIKDKRAFVLQGKLYKTGLYPGSYKLNTSMTSKQLLEALNTSEQDYLERIRKETSTDSSDELGAGADMVDEAQAKAAAAEGIEIETDAKAED